MGKPIALLAAGLLLLFMGVRSMSGYETEIEHTYHGQTVTVICRDGKPAEGIGMERQAAIEKCADSSDRQQSSVRIFIVLGLGLAGWGAYAIRKARR